MTFYLKLVRRALVFLILICSSTYGQVRKPDTVILVGWLTYDRTSAEAHFKDCRNNKIILLWQSNQEVDQLITAAKAKNAAYRIGQNGTMVHATIEAVPVKKSAQCAKTKYTDGCATMLKTVEVRRNNTGSSCYPR